MTKGDNRLFHHNITEVHHDQGRLVAIIWC